VTRTLGDGEPQAAATAATAHGVWPGGWWAPGGRGVRRAAPQRPAAGGRRVGKGRGRGRGDRAWDGTALAAGTGPCLGDSVGTGRGGVGSLGQDTTALGPLGEGRSAGRVAGDSARAAAGGGAVAAGG
jgi:hypothetical protein